MATIGSHLEGSWAKLIGGQVEAEAMSRGPSQCKPVAYGRAWNEAGSWRMARWMRRLATEYAGMTSLHLCGRLSQKSTNHRPGAHPEPGLGSSEAVGWPIVPRQ